MRLAVNTGAAAGVAGGSGCSPSDGSDGGGNRGGGRGGSRRRGGSRDGGKKPAQAEQPTRDAHSSSEPQEPQPGSTADAPVAVSGNPEPAEGPTAPPTQQVAELSLSFDDVFQ